MGKRLRIRYRGKVVGVDLRDSKLLALAEMPSGRAVTDVPVAVAAPLDAPPLQELPRGRREVVLLIRDRTRTASLPQMLRPLLADLKAGGPGPERVTLTIHSRGLHHAA